MNYHEWPEVLFISVWRALGYSPPDREIIDVENGNRACTKSPFWYCGCSSVSLYLNWRRSHIYSIGIGDMWIAAHSAKNLWPSTVTDMHFLSSCGYFSTRFIVKIKRNIFAVLNMSWKTSLRRYTNQITFLLLSLTELILLAISISTRCMAKNIRSHNECTSFIYSLTSGI